MYQVSIFNDNTETIIHYPLPNNNSQNQIPHLLSMNLKEKLSQIDGFSFSIPYNNPGYSLIIELSTKIKVYDTRDDSVVFSGRIMNISSKMNGVTFIKEVECEGALGFLMDTSTRRWNYINKTPTYILTDLLSKHNAKVDSSRQIHLGTIEITQSITIDTNYEPTLNAIITKLRNILGGDIRVRETNGILYLDYLTDQGSDNNVPVKLGYNMQDIIVEYDPMDLVNDVVPLGYGQGVNQLTITSVNGGVDHLEDATSIATYGRIEAPANNTEIQNANTLKIWGQTVLNEKKQPRLTLDIDMLDLSTLTGHEDEKFVLGDSLHIYNSVMGINNLIARVIERETDLLQPWNPKLIISTKPIRLSDQIIELRQRNMSLENAPQGSTYIDTFGYAENIDENHSFKLPIWLSPDILYVNRVRLHVDSQKFRAYERGLAAAAATTSTSSSGGGSTQTSSSAGQSTQTSSSGGGQTIATNTTNIFTSKAAPTTTESGNPVWDNSHWTSGNQMVQEHSHAYDKNHTHEINSHTHDVETPAHTHDVEIPAHSHDITIPAHTHNIEYGIFEDTYPEDVEIKIDNVAIPNITLSEGGSLDIEISQYVGTPGQTYNLEVTSSRNGRVNVFVSIQAFIQIK